MTLENKVVAIVRANTEGQKEVSLQTDLRRDLCLDSFGTIMVINALEEAFGVTVKDGDFTQVSSVADIVILLRTKYGCDHQCLAA